MLRLCKAGLVVYIVAPILALFLVEDLRSTADAWCSWCRYVTCIPLDQVFDWIPFGCNNDLSQCVGANATACTPPPCLQCPDGSIRSTVRDFFSPLSDRRLHPCVFTERFIRNLGHKVLSPPPPLRQAAAQDNATGCDAEGPGSVCPTSLCLQLCT